MRRQLKITYTIIGICAAAGFAVVLAPLLMFWLSVLIFTFPTNDRDNANPDKSSMVECTLLWGRLAPFPSTAKDFTIYTEGNSFARTFRGSFSDAPENIQKWLEASAGFTEGRDDDGERVLKMGEGASYGTIVVSEGGTRVTFRVSWS